MIIMIGCNHYNLVIDLSPQTTKFTLAWYFYSWGWGVALEAYYDRPGTHRSCIFCHCILYYWLIAISQCHKGHRLSILGLGCFGVNAPLDTRTCYKGPSGSQYSTFTCKPGRCLHNGMLGINSSKPFPKESAADGQEDT